MKLGEDFFNGEYEPAVSLITEVLDYLSAEWERTNDFQGGGFLDEVLPLAKKIEKLQARRKGTPQ
jgi:hypothetical protein